MTSRTRIFLLMIALFSVARLAAQGEAATWSIRVAAVDIAGEHSTVWLRTGEGKEPVEVPLNTRVFSPPTEFKGTAALAFHATAAHATAEEPPPPLATASLKSPASLLLFSPRADGKGYETYVITDSDFPFGSFRMVNLSRTTLRAELGGKPLILKPGNSETFAFREGRGAMPVRILAAVEGAPPRLIRQSSWSLVPTQRELILCFPSPGGGPVRLRHFVDTREDNPSGE